MDLSFNLMDDYSIITKINSKILYNKNILQCKVLMLILRKREGNVVSLLPRFVLIYLFSFLNFNYDLKVIPEPSKKRKISDYLL